MVIHFSARDTAKLTTAPMAARIAVLMMSPDWMEANMESNVPPTVPAAVP